MCARATYRLASRIQCDETLTQTLLTLHPAKCFNVSVEKVEAGGKKRSQLEPFPYSSNYDIEPDSRNRYSEIV